MATPKGAVYCWDLTAACCIPAACVCAHTAWLLCSLLPGKGAKRKKGALCKSAWQGGCAGRETCHPEVPPPDSRDLSSLPVPGGCFASLPVSISPPVKQRCSPSKGSVQLMLGTNYDYSVPAGKLAPGQIYLFFPASATLEKCPEMSHVVAKLLGEEVSTLLLSSAPVPRTTGSRAPWGKRSCGGPCRTCLSRTGEGPSGNP